MQTNLSSGFVRAAQVMRELKQVLPAVRRGSIRNVIRDPGGQDNLLIRRVVLVVGRFRV